MDDSSSDVATIVRGRTKRVSREARHMPPARQGKNPSCRTRPTRRRRSSDSVSANGSLLHRASSHGTVSVCPDSASPSPGGPNVAIRFALAAFPGNGMRSTVPPRSSSQVARWSMTSRLLWSCASDVQLTDGVETSVRNISLMGGNFMRGCARLSGRARSP